MTLTNKSITEIRGIAQAMGIAWSFGDTKEQLITKIERKRDFVIEDKKPIEIPFNPDQRLRSKPPANIVEVDKIVAYLKPFIERGLHFEISEDGQCWTMKFAEREDSGTMRQPPRVVIDCARKMLQ